MIRLSNTYFIFVSLLLLCCIRGFAQNKVPDGLTPLMRAAWKGDVEQVTQLLRAKTDVNTADKEGAATSEELKVTLKLVHADLLSAIKQVCGQAKVSYVVNLEGCSLRPITLTLKAIPFTEAMIRLLAAGQGEAILKFRNVHGIVVICQRPKSYTPAGESSSSPLKERLHIHLKPKKSLYVAIKAVLSSLPLNFTLDPRLRQSNAVTMTQNLPADKTLLLLMRSSQAPLILKSENGIICISEARPDEQFDGH